MTGSEGFFKTRDANWGRHHNRYLERKCIEAKSGPVY